MPVTVCMCVIACEWMNASPCLKLDLVVCYSRMVMTAHDLQLSCLKWWLNCLDIVPDPQRLYCTEMILMTTERVQSDNDLNLWWFLYDDPFGPLSPNQSARKGSRSLQTNELCFYKDSGPFTLRGSRETTILIYNDSPSTFLLPSRSIVCWLWHSLKC